LFPYNARTNITSGNPGNTNIIWNNATQASATQINISHLDSNNFDIDVILALIQNGTKVILQDANNSTQYQIWTFDAGTEVAPNSYWEFPVTFVSSTFSFTGGENILLIIASQPSGTSGSSGSSGQSGSSGSSGISGSAGTSGTSQAGLNYTAVFAGNGAVITPGIITYVRAPRTSTITKVTLLADQTGSAVLDIWKDTYANFPPTIADSICGSSKPTLSSAIKYEDSTLSTWTTSITAGDVLGFYLDSCSTITQITLQLETV
jgi:hypothetical protein